jgi:hypothetical protein
VCTLLTEAVGQVRSADTFSRCLPDPGEGKTTSEIRNAVTQRSLSGVEK